MVNLLQIMLKECCKCFVFINDILINWYFNRKGVYDNEEDYVCFVDAFNA